MATNRTAEEIATLGVILCAHAGLLAYVNLYPDITPNPYPNNEHRHPMHTTHVDNPSPVKRDTSYDHLFPRWPEFTRDDYLDIAREQRDRELYLEEIGEHYTALEPAEIARWAEHNARHMATVERGGSNE